MADLIMLLPRMVGITLCMWLSGWIPMAVCNVLDLWRKQTASDE